MLEVHDLTVRYGGVTALDSVNMEIPQGAFHGLIGPNGAGKTTMIDAITGMTRCSGTVRFGGEPVDRWPAHRRSGAGLVRTFQSLELFNELTARENLETYAGVKDHDRAQAAVDEALDLMDIGWAAELYPSELSHGQARLLSVARALAGQPRLLLLDEPAAGLDADESQWLGRRLRALVDERGLTILLVDHDVELIMNVCDQILVLDFGKQIGSGTPEEVRHDPAVVRAYLGGDLAEDGEPA